jgi:hypothetical protein
VGPCWGQTLQRQQNQLHYYKHKPQVISPSLV